MTTIEFLTEWALRSSFLILGGALLLWVLRVKDPAIRLAGWTAVLCGSLAIPALTAALPRVPLTWTRVASLRVEGTAAAYDTAPLPVRPPSTALEERRKPAANRFDWARAAVAIYLSVALALLLRLAVGLALSRRLTRGSRPTGRTAEGIEIRESERVPVPVTLGIVRAAIVLPADWRGWDSAKLEAVLAHERSHIRRRDPAVQLLSAIHRAVLWHSPLSWLLHSRIVRLAEEASDDAAVAATRDRALYAGVLLEFVGRRSPRAHWAGVPMARYGRPDKRIYRILDGTSLSRGVTRGSLAAILLLGSPLAWVVAAAQPASAPPETAQSASPARPAAAPQAAVPMVTSKPAAAPQPRQSAAPAGTPPAFLRGLGNVAPFQTVIVKSKIDGELTAVSFKEGDAVEKGQLLASIDPGQRQIELEQARVQLAQDQAELARIQKLGIGIGNTDLEARLIADKARFESVQLQMSYTQIHSPISGIVGLRLLDPGNLVHASDTAIVVITQIQPIAVLFTIREDDLPQVRARMAEGASLTVEAWNRDDSRKLATGRLTAIDNQIDETSGTLKLKAVFDNHDGALYPNQFVNARLYLNPR